MSNEEALYGKARELVLRDFPDAHVVFGVATPDGVFALDYADSSDIEEESFCDFADDTRAAVSATFVGAADYSRAIPRCGRWELYADATADSPHELWIWAL